MNSDKDQPTQAPEAPEAQAVVAPEAVQPVAAPATPSGAPAAAHAPTNGLAVASLIVGIVAVLSGWIPFWGFIVGAAAVVLGIIALKKAHGKGMAIAGIITGGLGALTGLFFMVLTIIAWTSFATIANEATGGVNSLQDAVNNIDDDAKAQISAKKDFSKGETGRFGAFEVTITSVRRDYVPESKYDQASSGKELIVLSLTIKNVSEESEYFSAYSYKVNDGGVLVGKSYAVVDSGLETAELTAGGSTKGDLVYEVTKGASALKLQTTDTVWLLGEGKTEEVTYTLAF